MGRISEDNDQGEQGLRSRCDRAIPLADQTHSVPKAPGTLWSKAWTGRSIARRTAGVNFPVSEGTTMWGVPRYTGGLFGGVRRIHVRFRK